MTPEQTPNPSLECTIHDRRDTRGTCSCSEIVATLRTRLAEISRLASNARLEERLCRARWHEGLLAEPKAPKHGAKCTYEIGHDGDHSFIVDAVALGWKKPPHLGDK